MKNKYKQYKEKYTIGDLIIETCFFNVEDYQLYIVTDVGNDGKLLRMKNKDGSEWVYAISEVERWIERNNAKHVPVKKD